MELRHQVTRCLIILFTGVSLAPRFSSLLFGNRLILWCCPNIPMRMSLGVMNFSEDTHSLPLPLVPTEKFSVVREFGSWPAYQRLLCPALLPSSAVSWGDGVPCDHEQFSNGCIKDVNWEQGGQMCMTLDRTSPLYKAVYTQRISCERINSQIKEFGIERSKLRDKHSVANLNTFIYFVINVRTLQKSTFINSRILQIS